jgi:hypothetical protein
VERVDRKGRQEGEKGKERKGRRERDGEKGMEKKGRGERDGKKEKRRGD